MKLINRGRWSAPGAVFAFVLGIFGMAVPFTASAIDMDAQCTYYAEAIVTTGSTSWTYPAYVECIEYPSGEDLSYSDPYYGVPGGGGGGESQVCSSLKASKPSNCPDPIPAPSGAEYGYESFPSGSGLAQLIALKNSGQLLEGSRRKVEIALYKHTSSIATITTPLATANKNLLVSLQEVCEYQDATALPGAYGTSNCIEAYARLTQEAGNGTFLDWLRDYSELNSWNLPIIGQLAPDNSLTKKFNMVTTDQMCSDWWREIDENDCGVDI